MKKDSAQDSHGNSPPEVPPPDPMELAKLAAILEPKFEPKYGLKKAMEFYLEAVLFLSELPSDFEKLLLAFGNTDRLMASMVRKVGDLNHAIQADSLVLDPSKDEDDARVFLNEQARQAGHLVKRVRLFKSGDLVLKNLRACYESVPVAPLTAGYHRTTDQFIEDLKCKENGAAVVYQIPRSWLVYLVEYKKDKMSQARKKSWKTRKRSAKPRAEKPVKKRNKNLQRKIRAKRLR